MRKRIKGLVSFLLSSIIASNSLPLTSLADELNSPNFYSIETNNEYEVTTNISPTWENHANVQMTLSISGVEQ